MNRRVKLLLLSLIIMAMPLLAGRFEPERDTPPPPWMPSDGSGGGTSTSCAVTCPDGSVSGIGCNTGEVAYCGCYPERTPDAWPYCS